MEALDLWATAALTTFVMAAIGHLYRIQSKMQEKIESALAKQLQDLWITVREMQRESTQTRVEIASKMVTRDDLRGQMKDLITELDRRDYITRPKIRGRDTDD